MEQQQGGNQFVEPGKKTLTYDKYLKIHELLSLQEELSDPKEHDETLFIIIHQVYELWFKQILHETLRCQSLLDADVLLPALRSMRRIDAIQKVLIKQIDVLETMAPDEFNRFRSHLNPASGFQSHQFRVLEYKLGLKNRSYFKYYKHEPATIAKLEEVIHEPSLYDSFLRFLARKGFNTLTKLSEKPADHPHSYDEEVTQIFASIYQDHLQQHDLYSFLEALTDLDEQFILWRYRHMLMVERMIGSLSGTGGSLGAKYLATTLEKRLFPELWAARNTIGTRT
ncbi:MAG: tryptophan 2,3-dioxygenase [Pseudobacteriovorax sp.]|nr:tryptophan 2,3-dioxygenase [Pseudobacteriovorax sp.]